MQVSMEKVLPHADGCPGHVRGKNVVDGQGPADIHKSRGEREAQRNRRLERIPAQGLIGLGGRRQGETRMFRVDWMAE